MAQKCPKMPTIRQYLTLFDFEKGICFLYETNRLACFDPIGVPNSKMNTEYFRIIFFNRIIRPSLVDCSKQSLEHFNGALAPFHQFTYFCKADPEKKSLSWGQYAFFIPRCKPKRILYFFYIQVILYFKVYLMTCPAVLLSSCLPESCRPSIVAWPNPINVSAIRRRLIIRELIIGRGC